MIILHCTKNGSDKVWAIDNEPNPNQTYTVWYGRRTQRLSVSHVSISKSADQRIAEKRDKGYVQLGDNARIKDGFLHEEAVPQEPIASACWYRVKPDINTHDLVNWLKACLDAVRTFDECEACDLSQHPTFLGLMDDRRNGKAEYLAGPAGILLLFALRKHFGSSCIDVVDDDGQSLPMSFRDMETLLSEVILAWEPSSDSSTSSTLTVGRLKSLAIAIGALDLPVDLSAISTETPALFF